MLTTSLHSRRPLSLAIALVAAMSVLLTLVAPAGAADGSSAKTSTVVATYKLKKIRKKAAKIRSARLKSHKSAKARRKSLPVKQVRKAARKGVLKVKVPTQLLAPNRKAHAANAAVAPTLVVSVGGKQVEIKPEVTAPAKPSTAKPVAPKPPVASGPCSIGAFSGLAQPGGCWRPYSDSSPFNRRLPTAPRLAGNSDAIVRSVLDHGPVQHIRAGVSGRDDDYGDVTYWSAPTDPEYTVHCVEDWGECDIEGHRVRIPAIARPVGGSDGHMTVVDQQTGWEYDFWTVRGKADGVITIGWGGRTRIDGDGLGSDATAARFGNLAGKLRIEELEAGQINHALFFAVGCDNGKYVYPAMKSGLSCSEVGKSTADAPAMGMQFMLDMTPAEIAALDVPEWKKTILRALAEYGAFFGDTGGNLAIATESGLSHTAYGQQDKWVTFAKANDVPYYAPDDLWVMNMRDGVDWQRHLKVVDPCVAQGTC